MRDYSKLTKGQLVALLERLDRQLCSCVCKVEQEASKQPPDHKYAYISGALSGTISAMKRDLAET